MCSLLYFNPFLVSCRNMENTIVFSFSGLWVSLLFGPDRGTVSALWNGMSFKDWHRKPKRLSKKKKPTKTCPSVKGNLQAKHEKYLLWVTEGLYAHIIEYGWSPQWGAHFTVQCVSWASNMSLSVPLDGFTPWVPVQNQLSSCPSSLMHDAPAHFWAANTFPFRDQGREKRGCYMGNVAQVLLEGWK